MPLVNKTFSDIITFTRASTATYFDSAGVLQSAAINVPRLDYNPATLAARGLLIEEQRTNGLTYSEEFDNAAWTKSGAAVTANSTAAPSGTTTADTLTEDTSTGQHRVFRSISGTTNTNPYTLSVFAKASARTRVYLGLAEGTSFVRQGNAVFDLSAGTVVFVGSGSGGATGGSATIQNIGNGWYRCTYTLTLGGTDTTIFTDLNLVSTGTTINYTGNGTGSIFIWGAQLEAGAFPTSYIPTTTTALTRSADVASVNTLSPWYNASASTLYVEYTIATSRTSDPTLARIDDGSDANRIQASTGASFTVFNAFLITANVAQGTNTVSINPLGTHKTAFALTTNDSINSADGSVGPQDTTVALPSGLNRFTLGNSNNSSSFINGHLRRITYYPRRLSNAELVSITS